MISKSHSLEESTPQRGSVRSGEVVAGNSDKSCSFTYLFIHLWHKDWLLFPVWTVKRPGGGACPMTIICFRDLQGVWMSSHPGQYKMDEPY